MKEYHMTRFCHLTNKDVLFVMLITNFLFKMNAQTV